MKEVEADPNRFVKHKRTFGELICCCCCCCCCGVAKGAITEVQLKRAAKCG